MKEEELARRIRIVLVDTRDGANIGSVCRAMKTMGLRRLALACPNRCDPERVRTLAVHAFDLWEERAEYGTLEEALAGSAMSFAATRRAGKLRKTSTFSPEQMASHISQMGDGTVSIVFGRETDGLTDAEVNLCNAVVTIPTSEAFPSLNLAQSVQIVCYCLRRGFDPWPFGKTVAEAARIDEAAARSIEAVASTGYFKNGEERRLTSLFLRDMIARSGPTEAELRKVERIFTKLAKIKIHKETPCQQ